MRKRSFAVASSFVAAAGLALLAATAASAAPAPHQRYFTPSGGVPIGSNANCTITPSAAWDTPGAAGDCAQAGYVASGRDFRFAAALVTVPDHTSTAADPSVYVGLETPGTTFNYAKIGIKRDGAGGWEVFSAVYQTGGSTEYHIVAIPPSGLGAGVPVSVYLAGDNALQFAATPPGEAATNWTATVASPVYTTAVALADWAFSGPKPAPSAPTAKVRDTQFQQGQFTTLSGAHGTFRGPWALNGVQATSNGQLPPSGTLIGDPSYLWTDGASYHGLAGDAFGVWRYPF